MPLAFEQSHQERRLFSYRAKRKFICPTDYGCERIARCARGCQRIPSDQWMVWALAIFELGLQIHNRCQPCRIKFWLSIARRILEAAGASFLASGLHCCPVRKRAPAMWGQRSSVRTPLMAIQF